jgi:hypothetical protein
LSATPPPLPPPLLLRRRRISAFNARLKKKDKKRVNRET